VSNHLTVSNLKERLLWLLGFRKRFRVTGNSMMPLLNPGDIVLVNLKAYKHTTPNKGDIIVAKHPYLLNVNLIKQVKAVLDDGRCFIIGVNKNLLASTDSRAFGPIAQDRILGQVSSRFA
jgi:nickel-type superoxide dismutase maturation protease